MVQGLGKQTSLHHHHALHSLFAYRFLTLTRALRFECLGRSFDKDYSCHRFTLLLFASTLSARRSLVLKDLIASSVFVVYPVLVEYADGVNYAPSGVRQPHTAHTCRRRIFWKRRFDAWTYGRNLPTVPGGSRSAPREKPLP